MRWCKNIPRILMLTDQISRKLDDSGKELTFGSTPKQYQENHPPSFRHKKAQTNKQSLQISLIRRIMKTSWTLVSVQRTKSLPGRPKSAHPITLAPHPTDAKSRSALGVLSALPRSPHPLDHCTHPPLCRY